MKPHVICHMCTSIDGKIMGNRWGVVAGHKGSAHLFETTADSFGIGAWIVGTTTMKEFAGRNIKLAKAKTRIERGDHIADRQARRFAVGVDANAVLRFQKPEVDGDHVVLLITEKAGNDYLAHLQTAGVSYLMCGKIEVNLTTALDKLRQKFGIQKLMLEGGGKFNGSMLNEELVDEISHVVVPIADGGAGISGIFDIPGKAPPFAAAKLRLISHRVLPGGVLWSRYRVVGRPAKTSAR